MIRTGQLLDPILRNLGIEEGVRLLKIKNDWCQVFRKPLSVHMFPSILSEGELLLNVDSPIWIQQLEYHKREITRKLECYGVRNVRFRLGKIRIEKPEKTSVEIRNELSQEDSIFISDLLAGVHDDTIKESIRNAVKKSLKSGRIY